MKIIQKVLLVLVILFAFATVTVYLTQELSTTKSYIIVTDDFSFDNNNNLVVNNQVIKRVQDVVYQDGVLTYQITDLTTQGAFLPILFLITSFCIIVLLFSNISEVR